MRAKLCVYGIFGTYITRVNLLLLYVFNVSVLCDRGFLVLRISATSILSFVICVKLCSRWATEVTDQVCTDFSKLIKLKQYQISQFRNHVSPCRTLNLKEKHTTAQRNLIFYKYILYRIIETHKLSIQFLYSSIIVISESQHWGGTMYMLCQQS